jgi:hypothetical protein
MTSEEKICGICVIKDAADLVPFLCGHYLRIGFDRLVFVDDHSSDATYRVLQSIKRKQPRVSVKRTNGGVFQQAALMTETANQVVAEGYTIIFPFDSDEFWNIDARRIRAAATSSGSGLFVGRWVQFVQSRQCSRSSRSALLAIRNRAPVLPDTNLKTVESFRRSFVCVPAPKVGFKSDGPVEIGRGQHGLISGPTKVLAADLEVFHLPLRSAVEIDQRARRAAAFLETAQPGESWQSIHFRDAVAAGKQDEVWSANSASEDGCLDLRGERIILIPDNRLRTLLIRAWLYLALRYPGQLLMSR